MKKSKIFIFIGILVSLMLIMSVSEVIGTSGGGGEGDDCLDLNYKNIGGPYKGTLIGWIDNNDGKLKLCTPDGSPLVRSNSDCTMEIPCDNPYVFGSYLIPSKDNPVCPEDQPGCDCNIVKCEKNFKPSHLMGWCRTGLRSYVLPTEFGIDACPYGLPVAGYESIDASNPKYIPNDPNNSFTVDIVIMPMYLSY